MSPDLRLRREDDRELTVLVWRFDAPVQVISSGPHGGGIGPRRWVLNAQVSSDYVRLDPDEHVREIASELGLPGTGTGMLTAVDVARSHHATDGPVEVTATVGLGQPTWAAAPDRSSARAAGTPVGTINVFAWVPAALGPAALVNAVATVTEAKVQALFDAAVAATGTATDAVVVACPVDGPIETFGGPRSTWGAPLARAVHRAVLAGAQGSAEAAAR